MRFPSALIPKWRRHTVPYLRTFKPSLSQSCHPWGEQDKRCHNCAVRLVLLAIASYLRKYHKYDAAGSGNRITFSQNNVSRRKKPRTCSCLKSKKWFATNNFNKTAFWIIKVVQMENLIIEEKELFSLALHLDCSVKFIFKYRKLCIVNSYIFSSRS